MVNIKPEVQEEEESIYLGYKQKMQRKYFKMRNLSQNGISKAVSVVVGIVCRD